MCSIGLIKLIRLIHSKLTLLMTIKIKTEKIHLFYFHEYKLLLSDNVE